MKKIIAGIAAVAIVTTMGATGVFAKEANFTRGFASNGAVCSAVNCLRQNQNCQKNPDAGYKDENGDGICDAKESCQNGTCEAKESCQNACENNANRQLRQQLSRHNNH